MEPWVSRFWAKVARSETVGECWLWRGAGKKYGHFGIAGKTLSVHRISWELAHGPIPLGKQVCHSCDVPKCVNPAHLFLCTQSENLLDMWAKGRGVPQPDSVRPRGERHGMAILAESQVLEMRRLYASGGVSIRDLARRFGVGRSTAHEAISGKRWAHLPLDGSRPVPAL